MMAEMLRRRNLNHVEADRDSGASTPTSQPAQDPHMAALIERLAEMERLKRQKVGVRRPPVAFGCATQWLLC